MKKELSSFEEANRLSASLLSEEELEAASIAEVAPVLYFLQKELMARGVPSTLPDTSVSYKKRANSLVQRMDGSFLQLDLFLEEKQNG